MSDDRPHETERPRRATRLQFRLRTMLLFIAGIGLVLGLTLRAFRDMREETGRLLCANNLKQIGLALQNYHDTFKSLPPAYIPGPDGKPWHSWRLLILPYLTCSPFYDQYRFGEPWDGPNNRKLIASYFDTFYFLQCPVDDQSAPTMTSYLAVVGPGTAWPGAEPSRFEDFRDGPSNTILVVEVVDSGIHAMEPRDLNVENLPEDGAGGAGLTLSSNHARGVHVLFADGSVRCLPRGVARQKLMALVTRAGGEPVRPEDVVVGSQ